MLKRYLMVVMVVVCVAGLMPGQAALGLQAQGGALEQLLGQVADGPISRTVIWYGATIDLGKVLGVDVSSQQDFQAMKPQLQAAYALDFGSQVYKSSFNGVDQAAAFQRTFGLDPFAIDRELTVGIQPNWYAILTGNFNAGNVTQALQALGYKSSQVNQATVFSLGADNAPDAGAAGKLMQSRYNRLVVSDKQILAAPATPLIQVATTTGKALIADPAYLVLVRNLEAPATIANTQLLSGVLLSGQYLGTLLGGQPHFQTAAIGFRRDATNRYWLIDLVYQNAADAEQAKNKLASGLGQYASPVKGGRKLFEGWKIAAKVTPADNGLQVVTVSLQLPQQTDLSWIELVQSRDLGFLSLAQ